MLNVKLDAELSKGITRYLEEETDATDVVKRKNEGVMPLQQLGERLGLQA